MVSRLIRKTPTKSIKDSRGRHRRKSSPVKKSPSSTASASTVISTINKSFFNCHRRLIKLFSKLTQIGTPTNCRKNKGYKILKKTPENLIPNPRRLITSFGGLLLPPLISPEKKRTIFLDLDETLVHSKPDPPPKRFDFVVRPRIEGETLNFYVLKRPGVDELLEYLRENDDKFEVVVFTAGLREYASLVLDKLDGNREYSLQPENGVLVQAFVDDVGGDCELSKFESSYEFDDIREAVKHYINANSNN